MLVGDTINPRRGLQQQPMCETGARCSSETRSIRRVQKVAAASVRPDRPPAAARAQWRETRLGKQGTRRLGVFYPAARYSAQQGLESGQAAEMELRPARQRRGIRPRGLVGTEKSSWQSKSARSREPMPCAPQKIPQQRCRVCDCVLSRVVSLQVVVRLSGSPKLLLRRRPQARPRAPALSPQEARNPKRRETPRGRRSWTFRSHW